MGIPCVPVTTGIPGIVARYDDGAWTQLENVREWLRRRMPISMSISIGTLRDAGNLRGTASNTPMRKADLKAILADFDAEGVEIEILNHANTNWTAVADHGFTWDQILEELDPRPLEDLIGRKVYGYAQPGEAENLAFVQPRMRMIVDALQELGYEYAQGIAQLPNGAILSGGAVQPFTAVLGGGFYNSSTDLSNITEAPNGIQVLQHAMRPGMILDPFAMPRTISLDLTSFFVPRGTKDGSDLLPDPHSGAAPWMFGEDNNGLGAEGGTNVANGHYTAQFLILRALGYGHWMQMAMHGDARSDSIVVSKLSAGRGSAGTPAALPGNFSSKHLASFVQRLRDNGHCRPMTSRQYVIEITSGFAVGTDIAENPNFAVPQIDVGETYESVPDMPFVRGIGVTGVGAQSISTGLFPLDASGVTQSGEGRLTPSPASYLGRGVTGWRGRPGGAILRPTGFETLLTKFRMGGAGLQPGVYRLSFAISNFASGNFTIDKALLIGSRWRYRTIESLPGNTLHQAIPEFTVRSGSSIYTATTVDTVSGEMQFCQYIECPREARPHRTGQVSAVAVTSLANGAEVLLGTATVPGVVIGAPVFAFPESQTLPAGVTTKAVAVNRDKVEVYVVNNSGGVVSITANDWIVVAEHVKAEEGNAMMNGPCSPWSYFYGFEVVKDTSTPMTLSGVRFELVEAR